MLPNWCEIVAIVVVAIIPFFLAARWEGVGFVACILLGWGLIHFTNEMCVHSMDDDDARTAAVFKGVWVVFGPVFMAIWSAFAAFVVLGIEFAIWVIRGRPPVQESKISLF